MKGAAMNYLLSPILSPVLANTIYIGGGVGLIIVIILVVVLLRR
jgi:hypothetical protein